MDAQLSYPWAYLVIQAALMIFAAAAGAYFGAYFKERGKNFATKADFDQLMQQLGEQTKQLGEQTKQLGEQTKQLREQTKLVETVKDEVGHKAIQRAKLEQLLNSVSDCQLYVKRYQQAVTYGDRMPVEHDPGSTLTEMTTLHFPELDKEVSAFVSVYRKLNVLVGELSEELGKTNNPDRRNQAFVAYREKNRPAYHEFLEAQSKLNNAARVMLVKINNGTD
jgi:hypothetical protein